ncbi:50S ribosomal protein L20 [Candidatus Gottesmanbacteria bacterium]|nr:50S ribosomal protein L20 [Candidatus Gottesmanbacteria bacterium]
MRIKRGVTSHYKHKKILAATKGFRGTKHRLIRVAKEASLHAGQYAYHGRKIRKRDFRQLWITRISEAIRAYDLNYSQFINKLKKANINLDRKTLSYFVTNEPETFKTIVEKAKTA